MNFWKKSACVAVAVLFLITTGCGADATWVYRNGETQMPAGIYLLYMINAVSSAETTLAGGGEDAEPYQVEDIKDLLKQTVEGKPADQWIIEETQKSARQYFAIEEKFAEAGLTLDESEHDAAQASAASTWQSYGEFFEQNGIAQSSYQLYVENSRKMELLFEHYYGEDGVNAVSDQEMKDYFSENFSKIEFLVMDKAYQDKTDEEGNVVATKDELLAETMERAKGYQTRMKDGETVEDLSFEQEKEDTEAAGGDPSTVTKSEPGERSVILSESMKGMYYSDELIDAALAAKVGEPEITEDNNFIYVIRRVDIMEDPADFEAYSENLLSLMKSEEFQTTVEGWADEAAPEANQAAIDKYKPSKLKTDE